MLSKFATTKTIQHRTILHKTMKSLVVDEVGMANGEVVDQEWVEVVKIRRRASWYLIEVECLTKSQATYVMDEIHRGICGFHLGGHRMVSRGAKSRILMANHEAGVQTVRTQLSMPSLWERQPFFGKGAIKYRITMVFFNMGNGHFRTILNGQRACQVLVHRGGLFH
ncbi:hypothetical protein CR513_33068, partial [Mucuna pruriens]